MLHHKSIGKLPKGKFADGAGLRFVAKGDGTGRWEVRYSINGKRRDAGLGTYPEVTLKQAREAAQDARTNARMGIDTAKRGNGSEARVVARQGMTIADALPLFLNAHEQALSTEKQRRYYANKAHKHIGEKLGHIQVEALTIDDLTQAYAAQWHSQFETLDKTLDQLRGVLNWARRRGLKADPLVIADFKDEQGRSRYVPKSFAKVAWQNAPNLYASISERSDMHIAAKLHMIVCTRIAPVLKARWQDMLTDDGEIADTWVIPRNFMKGTKIPGEEDLPISDQRPPHLVPITSEARRLLELLRAKRRPDAKWAFGRYRNGEWQPAYPSQVNKIMQELGANTHCARSCFSTWADETEAVARKTVEATLDHKTLKGARAKYNFARLVDQKRDSQERWESYLLGAQVVTLKTNSAAG